MPEIIDRVFAKTSQDARFLLSENERFGLVFVKTGSINSGTELENEPPYMSYTETKTTSWIGRLVTELSSYFTSILFLTKIMNICTMTYKSL